MLERSAVPAAALLLLLSNGAVAQLEPVEPTPPQPYDPGPPAGPAAPDAPTQPDYMVSGDAQVAAGAEPDFDSGANWGDPSDHQRVVGTPAIGFLGMMGIPVHGGDGDPEGLVRAPTLGIRYWFSEGLGIDAGLGVGLRTTSGTVSTSSSESDIPGTSVFGLGLHVGLPISAWNTAHYNALFIPEVNFGFATGEDEGMATGTIDNTTLTGLLFHVGVRGGAEFHLEFLDLPQASLQLTIGIGLALEVRDSEDTTGAGTSSTALEMRTNLVSLTDALTSGIQVFFYL